MSPGSQPRREPRAAKELRSRRTVSPASQSPSRPEYSSRASPISQRDGMRCPIALAGPRIRAIFANITKGYGIVRVLNCLAHGFANTVRPSSPKISRDSNHDGNPTGDDLGSIDAAMRAGIRPARGATDGLGAPAGKAGAF